MTENTTTIGQVLAEKLATDIANNHAKIKGLEHIQQVLEQLDLSAEVGISTGSWLTVSGGIITANIYLFGQRNVNDVAADLAKRLHAPIRRREVDHTDGQIVWMFRTPATDTTPAINWRIYGMPPASCRIERKLLRTRVVEEYETVVVCGDVEIGEFEVEA